MISVWTKQKDGKLQEEPVGYQHGWISDMQLLPDGRIVTSSDQEAICIWTRQADGKWLKENVGGENGIAAFQFLPDGRIVAVNYVDKIYLWTRNANGSWQREFVGEHGSLTMGLQVLRDGRIVTGSIDKTIRIWDGKPALTKS